MQANPTNRSIEPTNDVPDGGDDGLREWTIRITMVMGENVPVEDAAEEYLAMLVDAPEVSDPAVSADLDSRQIDALVTVRAPDHVSALSIAKRLIPS